MGWRQATRKLTMLLDRIRGGASTAGEWTPLNGSAS